MFTIEKALAKDFQRVHTQLQECFSSVLSEEEWKKSFVYVWNSPEDFFGYMLLKDGNVKGFLGLLFSQRTVDGKIEKFCNMHSWCVSDDCRSQSLSLLLETLKLKDYTITNFTASPPVAAILSRLGFKDFAVHQQVLLPVSPFRFRRRGWSCEFDLKKIRDGLGENDRTIFDDHQGFGCRHLLLTSGASYSYLILKKTLRKRLPFAKVHYLSDAGNFIECIESFMPKICLRLGVFGMMIDDRYLKGDKFRTGFSYPHQRRAYFKSNSLSDENLIDTLYSELVVLHS